MTQVIDFIGGEYHGHPHSSLLILKHFFNFVTICLSSLLLSSYLSNCKIGG